MIETIPDAADTNIQNLLTPVFYQAARDDELRLAVNKAVYFSQKEAFQHPFYDGAVSKLYSVPKKGVFGAQKGNGAMTEHHAAVDFHPDMDAQNTVSYAAHDGFVQTFRNVAKYRHYLTISKEIQDDSGEVVAKLVTLYAHVDLDKDEATGLTLDGQTVQQGDVVSKNLYAGTAGGPHLHFEVRYYRPLDSGQESFYGFGGQNSNSELTLASTGPWTLGVWSPSVGYGFADPSSYGVE